MWTMGIKGLALFHLKSHLQKYRLGKQSGKEMTDQSKDASFHLENPNNTALSPRVPMSDVNEGQEVKEALRGQMEVQRRLFEQVEVQKHVQIRMDAFHKYINSLLAKAYQIVSDQVALNSFASTEHGLAGMPGRTICTSPSDILMSTPSPSNVGIRHFSSPTWSALRLNTPTPDPSSAAIGSHMK